MKWLKILLGSLLTIVVIVALIGFILPKTTHVERSVILNASPDVIFDHVATHQAFRQWSPWSKRDPDMKVSFSGPIVGVGSAMEWSSDVPELGQGTSTYIEYSPPYEAVTKMSFGSTNGNGSNATARFTLKNKDNQDNVTIMTWALDAEHTTIFERYFGLLLDTLVGDMYEEGLADLKVLINLTPIVTKTIRYSVGDVDLKGYLAHPVNGDPRPGVLVVHEWWGHNAYARKRARMLASLGYSAFAVDMFGEGKLADHPKMAMGFVQTLLNDKDAAMQRFSKAADILSAQPMTSSNEKLSALGYCFGGSVVISMARKGMDLAGVVSFHGGLKGLAPINSKAQKNSSPEMLIFNGAADPFVTEDQKSSFKAEMDNASYEYTFIDYPEVLHSFTNPEANGKNEKFDLPLRYDADADSDSWQKTQVFLKALYF